MSSNIPFSLALRIVRICSREEDREKRFGELRQMLLDRDYKPNIINSSIEKARNIPREKALEKVVRQSDSRRQVFVLTYDPRLPSANQIVKKHWRVMVQDPVLREIFPLPPLIAYRRQKNVREFVIRAKVPPPPTRERRVLPGMKRCGKCVNCPYVQTGRTVSATHTNFSIDINAPVTCQTSNVIYCITCLHPKCRLQYLGKTDGKLTTRFGGHRRDVENKKDCAVGRHFNLPGHSVSDMRIVIVEKVHNTDPFFLRNRERHFIQMFKTRLKGLNINT